MSFSAALVFVRSSLARRAIELLEWSGVDAMALKRVAAFWNYLPAFVAVAETEHLRLAAQQLRVSPSSLSRMISLLEHHLGYTVFTRNGRRMTLNPAGQRLRGVVRQSIRLVDDAVSTRTAQE